MRAQAPGRVGVGEPGLQGATAQPELLVIAEREALFMFFETSVLHAVLVFSWGFDNGQEIGVYSALNVLVYVEDVHLDMPGWSDRVYHVLHLGLAVVAGLRPHLYAVVCQLWRARRHRLLLLACE